MLMKRSPDSPLTRLLGILSALTVTTLLLSNMAVAATAKPVDTTALTSAGFKTLVATSKVQEDWVRGLPAGKIRPMQRTGKKYYIYPDAPRKQVYVGGPKEYDAYVQRHPEHRLPDSQKQAKDASAYRAKQTEAMQSASARDLSDPFLGATWADLGW
jgi:hypothetical protein